MPYLGNAPAEAYSNIAYQDFGTQSGTTFTLDYPAGAPGELEVFVNNVRQEPSVAYTVSGTTLTMTGTIASTDDFYVVFQGKAQQTVRHPANTALEATTGTFSGALSATTGTFSGAVSMGANNITFSDGSGIDFSASAGSGASSSILDDYEEGTWTPRLRGGSTEPGTLITGNGVYTKIGNQVSVLIDFSNKNMTGYSGPVSVDSFPFAQASGSNAGGAAGMIYSLLNANNNREHTAFFMSNNSTILNLYDINAGAGWGSSQHGAPAGAYFWTTFTYFTS